MEVKGDNQKQDNLVEIEKKIQENKEKILKKFEEKDLEKTKEIQKLFMGSFNRLSEGNLDIIFSNTVNKRELFFNINK